MKEECNDLQEADSWMRMRLTFSDTVFLFRAYNFSIVFEFYLNVCYREQKKGICMLYGRQKIMERKYSFKFSPGNQIILARKPDRWLIYFWVLQNGEQQTFMASLLLLWTSAARFFCFSTFDVDPVQCWLISSLSRMGRTACFVSVPNEHWNGVAEHFYKTRLVKRWPENFFFSISNGEHRPFCPKSSVPKCDVSPASWRRVEMFQVALFWRLGGILLFDWPQTRLLGRLFGILIFDWFRNSWSSSSLKSNTPSCLFLSPVCMPDWGSEIFTTCLGVCRFQLIFLALARLVTCLVKYFSVLQEFSLRVRSLCLRS